MTVASKTCTKCLRDLPVAEYAIQKTSPDGLRYECRDCQRRYMAEWRANHRQYLRDASARRWEGMSEEEKARKRLLDLERYHAAPEIARDKLLRRKYGITFEDYTAMLAQQGGGCAICGGVNADGRVLHVDHHHGTGAVRGLLCQKCNHGIGLFRDTPDLLTRAIAYLLNT
jgi:hypothetical protein